jgi:hypothetical protein
VGQDGLAVAPASTAGTAEWGIDSELLAAGHQGLSGARHREKRLHIPSQTQGLCSASPDLEVLGKILFAILGINVKRGNLRML